MLIYLLPFKTGGEGGEGISEEEGEAEAEEEDIGEENEERDVVAVGRFAGGVDVNVKM